MYGVHYYLWTCLNPEPDLCSINSTHTVTFTQLCHIQFKSNLSTFKPFVALISPTIGFNSSCISEVSVRFQGCQWPFLASLWTPHCCWGGDVGREDWRASDSPSVTSTNAAKLSRRKALNPYEPLSLPAGIHSVSAALCAFVWVRFCFQKGSFLSFARPISDIYLQEKMHPWTSNPALDIIV